MENNINNTNVNETDTQVEEQKTYTQEELNALVQKISDQRVSQALKTQQKKYEKQISLANLDSESREKAERESRIQELEEQLKEFTILQNKQEIISVLGARGLNAQFADLIEIGDDVEAAQQRIETLDKLFKSAVADEVKKRLATGTPIKTENNSGEITVEQFKKMNLQQQAQLYKDNPELYKKLTHR